MKCQTPLFISVLLMFVILSSGMAEDYYINTGTPENRTPLPAGRYAYVRIGYGAGQTGHAILSNATAVVSNRIYVGYGAEVGSLLITDGAILTNALYAANVRDQIAGSGGTGSVVVSNAQYWATTIYLTYNGGEGTFTVEEQAFVDTPHMCFARKGGRGTMYLNAGEIQLRGALQLPYGGADTGTGIVYQSGGIFRINTDGGGSFNQANNATAESEYHISGERWLVMPMIGTLAGITTRDTACFT